MKKKNSPKHCGQSLSFIVAVMWGCLLLIFTVNVGDNVVSDKVLNGIELN